MPTDSKKTIIAALASHDSKEQNEKLALVLSYAIREHQDLISRYRFMFTGGTYERLFRDANYFNDLIIDGSETIPAERLREALKEIQNVCGIIRLPNAQKGGVTLLSDLITRRRVSIIWPFFSPTTSHLLNPENLALLRLCDQWHVKKLMNTGSVKEWIRKEAERDIERNRREPDFKVKFPKLEKAVQPIRSASGIYRIDVAKTPEVTPFPGDATIALISHDAMKDRMVDFVTDYERELRSFSRILATGTTGKLIEDAAPSLRVRKKILRYHSGPKGGDIEIATEILYGNCHVVVFFVDTLHPHPHIEDIRVVFGACMIQDEVRMLANEMQAREWMNRVLRPMTS